MEILYEGIILRPWAISDARQLALIADNKNIADNLRDGLPSPYTLQDAIDWLNLILPENNPPRYFAISIDKLLVGNLGFSVKKQYLQKKY